jgi:hypothetical protein
VEVASEMYDKEYPEGGCPPYMTIYHAGHSICEEQCEIVGKDVDLTVLSQSQTGLLLSGSHGFVRRLSHHLARHACFGSLGTCIMVMWWGYQESVKEPMP